MSPRYGSGVQVLPQNRSTLVYVALVTLLITGLAVGVALFVLQARGPGNDAEFAVAAGEPVDCPTGSGVPVCYRFDVTNSGGGASELECVAVPSDGGTAVFSASGSETYRSDGPVEVGDTYSLYVEAAPTGEGREVGRPEVACRVFA